MPPSFLHATSTPELAAFADLCREYARSLPFALDYQGFEAELAALPGLYAPPQGAVLLAMLDGGPVGCVAMRPLAIDAYRHGDLRPACEMKRMYVRTGARGLGIGRALGVALLDHARQAGYVMMKLDSERTFIEATTLYRSLGFEDCERYNDDPQPDTIWMRRSL